MKGIKTLFVAITMLSSFGLSSFPRLAFALPTQAAPVIEHLAPASVKAGAELRLSGSGFGEHGEVIAAYGNDFLYALNVSSWSDHVITVHLPDLGKSLKPVLYVRTATGLSAARRVHVLPQLHVERSSVRNHHLKVGDKGEDTFVFQSNACLCSGWSAVSWRFDQGG